MCVCACVQQLVWLFTIVQREECLVFTSTTVIAIFPPLFTAPCTHPPTHPHIHTHTHTAGQLSEAYDELGNRYVIPRYCLNKPTNMQDSDMATDTSLTSQTDSAQLLRQRGSTGGKDGAATKAPGISFTIKIRLSTLPKDIRVSVLTTDRVRDLKRKLQELHSVEPQRVTMLYSGRVLSNNTFLKHLNIPRGHVIQAIVS